MSPSRAAAAVLLVGILLACGGEDDGAPTPPAAPAGVSATPGNGSATVSFAPVAGATSYNVYFAGAPAVTTTGSKVTVSSPPATVPALANGSAYWFAVSAVNAAGESALSAAPCAVPTPAPTAGLTLYDPLCGAALDGSRWRSPGAYSTGVESGAAVLAVDVANLPPRDVRNEMFAAVAGVNAAGSRVTTLRSGVRVPAATTARSGAASVRASLRLAYQPPSTRLLFPGGNLHALALEVGLVEKGGGLQAFRQVVHCDDASCATISSANVAFTDPPAFAALDEARAGAPAAYDTEYTMTARLDEATGVFHWTVAGGAFGAGVSGSANPAAYLTATAGWAGVPLAGAGFLNAWLHVRAADDAGGGSGRIAGRFTNVEVGLDDGAAAPFDDFSGANGNSGPTGLSSVKWIDPGRRSIAPSGGSLEMRLDLTDGTVANLAQSLPLTDASPHTLQADVTVPASSPAPSLTQFALSGSFYNDGTPGTTAPDLNQPNSALGDVAANLALRPSTNDAGWFVFRCQNAQCAGGVTVVGAGTIPGATAGPGLHTLRLTWNAAARTLTFVVDGHAVTVDPTTAGPEVTAPARVRGPPNWKMRRIFTTAGAGGGVASAARITAAVNNVFVAP